MPIPVFKIPIDLTKDTPSKVTPEELKKELNDIGLRCGETRVEKLEQYIRETLDQFPDGKVQGFGIYEYRPPAAEEFFEKGFTTKSLFDLAVSIDDLHSNWKPDDAVPYMTKLAIIGVPEHFDCLKEKYTGFAGCKQSQTYDENDTTVNAVKSQFTRIATSISSTLIDELDKNQMEAVFSKIIAPVDPGSANYDSGLQNRNIYLVKGYTEHECEAIGIINVEYQLKIYDYKDKKTLHKSYHLDVTVRTSLYNDLNPLYAEVEFIKSTFKNAMFFSKFSIPLNVDVKIYDTLPPACEDTFIHSCRSSRRKTTSYPRWSFMHPTWKTSAASTIPAPTGRHSTPKRSPAALRSRPDRKYPAASNTAQAPCSQKQNLTSTLRFPLPNNGTRASPKPSPLPYQKIRKRFSIRDTCGPRYWNLTQRTSNTATKTRAVS